ncbi:MAG: exosome complex RNA-binding protein Csl4 [Thermoproteota archaeon]|nr:exosome complex RNA-binding protein Csl4 [Thermoproteota archaeon]
MSFEKNQQKRYVRSPILPGEHLAYIEEFDSGKNTYIDNGSVRSTTVGTKVYDFRNRTVKIDQKNSPMLPKIGDVLVGFVEMLFGSMLSIRVLFINDKKSSSGFSAITSARVSISGGWGRERGDRRGGRVVFRVGDIIRGRVVSLLNSTIHIVIDEKEFGVLYTLCFNCGGDTVRVNNSTIKCIECGLHEERKLTNDYGKETFGIIHKTGSN